ncbi:MAG: hypothetical protein HZC55_18280 [Verrucomicrobia bacterium]|nr:hypothetical protein [Verrucomicrobiota bacterium]
MPTLLRLIVVIVLAFVAGSVVTPLLWRSVLVEQGKEILSPFGMLSAGILITAVGIAVAQIRKLL